MRTWAAIIVFIVLGGCGQTSEPAWRGVAEERRIVDADLAFIDVSVIPMTEEVVHEHQTVLIRNGVIVAVAPTSEIVPGEDALIVRGENRFLMPGLADMHAHVFGETELKLYVANGVTLLRNMWGSPVALAMRARVDSGAIVGPRIVTVGNLVDGYPPIWGATSSVARDPNSARALMDEQKAAGFDFFKVYELISPETFDAIAAHAQEIDFPFAGHVPASVSLEHAMRSGMASIEHLSGWSAATGVQRPGAAEGAALLRQIQAGDIGWDVLFDAGRRRSMAALAAETSVWHVPTLSFASRVYTSRRQSDVQFARPEMRYMSPRLRAGWDPSTNSGLRRLSDDVLEAFQILLKQERLRVKDLHDAGARLLVGTDAPNPFILHGFSIHEELELLVDAGLRPYDALVGATRAPAEFLSDPSFGTIEVGQSANAVMLDSNPLQAIAATKAIRGVVVRGRWLPREELDAMLEAVAADYKTPDDWFEGVIPSQNNVESSVYTMTADGMEMGAERIAGLFGQDLSNPADAQRTWMAGSGDRVVEVVRLRTHDDGTFAGLTYTQSVPSGTAKVSATLTGRRLSLSGCTIDGRPIAQSVELQPGEIVSCDLIACLGKIVSNLEDLGIGEQHTLGVRMLTAATGGRREPSGDPRFDPETWELTRADDEGEARVYEGTLTRGRVPSPLRIVVDTKGLFRIERRAAGGLHESERL